MSWEDQVRIVDGDMMFEPPVRKDRPEPEQGFH